MIRYLTVQKNPEMKKKWPDQSVGMELDFSQQFVLKLIQDDLINIQLVVGNEKKGLDAQQYYLCLTEKVFAFLNMEADSRLYKLYFDMAIRVMELDASRQEQICSLSTEIYAMLLSEKKHLTQFSAQ